MKVNCFFLGATAKRTGGFIQICIQAHGILASCSRYSLSKRVVDMKNCQSICCCSTGIPIFFPYVQKTKAPNIFLPPLCQGHLDKKGDGFGYEVIKIFKPSSSNGGSDRSWSIYLNDHRSCRFIT